MWEPWYVSEQQHPGTSDEGGSVMIDSEPEDYFDTVTAGFVTVLCALFAVVLYPICFPFWVIGKFAGRK